jgi:hypothetical protein
VAPVSLTPEPEQTEPAAEVDLDALSSEDIDRLLGADNKPALTTTSHVGK